MSEYSLFGIFFNKCLLFGLDTSEFFKSTSIETHTHCNQDYAALICFPFIIFVILFILILFVRTGLLLLLLLFSLLHGIAL